MIYKGTFPERPDTQGELNVVDQGDTGRGKWARGLIKHGKDVGQHRKPALAWLWLGGYWTHDMPPFDKNYWVTRATEHMQVRRDGNSAWVTGFSLFLMANTGPMSLGIAPLRIPIPVATGHDPITLYSEAQAALNRVKVYHWYTDGADIQWSESAWWSAIHVKNSTDSDPVKMTRLIAYTVPNHYRHPGEGPTDPIYLPLPWAIDVGDWVGIYIAGRGGGQGEFYKFRVNRFLPLIVWKRAV